MQLLCRPFTGLSKTDADHHSDAARQSAQDIAREVARQLDERERRLKAKAGVTTAIRGIRRMMMVLGLYVFMLRTVPYQELQYQRSWRHAANSRVNRRPSTAVSGTGQRHADAFRCSYAGDNGRQAVVAGSGADGRTGKSMA